MTTHCFEFKVENPREYIRKLLKHNKRQHEAEQLRDEASSANVSSTLPSPTTAEIEASNLFDKAQSRVESFVQPDPRPDQTCIFAENQMKIKVETLDRITVEVLSATARKTEEPKTTESVSKKQVQKDDTFNVNSRPERVKKPRIRYSYSD